MRRTLTAVACVLLLALCIWLMELVEPVEAPQPTPTEAQPTPTEAQPPTPTPTPEPTPGTVSIPSAALRCARPESGKPKTICLYCRAKEGKSQC